jgi:hypothetical protein
MRIYISTKHEHILLIPCKTGSSSVNAMLRMHESWECIFIGKKVTNPKTILDDYIEMDWFSHYTTVLLIRDPIDWIISGYRYMQKDKRKISKNYPTIFNEHLLSILNDKVDCEHWKRHCCYQPLDYYNDNYIFFKLEEFETFKKYLDINCNSDYIKYKDYHFNKNQEIEYPQIKHNDISLLYKIANKHNMIGKYDLSKTINRYQNNCIR